MNLLTIRDFGTVYNVVAFIVIIILFLQFVNSTLTLTMAEYLNLLPCIHLISKVSALNNFEYIHSDFTRIWCQPDSIKFQVPLIQSCNSNSSSSCINNLSTTNVCQLGGQTLKQVTQKCCSVSDSSQCNMWEDRRASSRVRGQCPVRREHSLFRSLSLLNGA